MNTKAPSQTPAERKAAAIKTLDADLNLLPHCDCGEEAMRLIDAYARACIDEAVAPALEYIDELYATGAIGYEAHRKLRRLLTEGRE